MTVSLSTPYAEKTLHTVTNLRIQKQPTHNNHQCPCYPQLARFAQWGWTDLDQEQELGPRQLGVMATLDRHHQTRLESSTPLAIFRHHCAVHVRQRTRMVQWCTTSQILSYHSYFVQMEVLYGIAAGHKRLWFFTNIHLGMAIWLSHCPHLIQQKYTIQSLIRESRNSIHITSPTVPVTHNSPVLRSEAELTWTRSRNWALVNWRWWQHWTNTIKHL